MQACKTEEAKVPYYNTPDLTPVWEQGGGKHTIADFKFRDQEGNEVSNQTFEGKIYVTNFFFTTCPSICPKMRKNMQTVLDEFKEDDRVLFLSHTVTPYIDSVPVLKKFAGIHGIDANKWHLVTGSQAAIYDIARTSYFTEEEMGFKYDSTDFLHTERFVLVDKDKHLRGMYNGTIALEMQRLIDDIQLLLKEEG